eukprot:COSAG02_NODE_3684_length_6385_cov_4.179287_3_plen_518_part_00
MLRAHSCTGTTSAYCSAQRDTTARKSLVLRWQEAAGVTGAGVTGDGCVGAAMNLGVSFADFSLTHLAKSVSKHAHLSHRSDSAIRTPEEGQVRSESLIMTADVLAHLRNHANEVSTQIISATNEKLEAWRKLRVFVGLSEEVQLVEPMRCQPCGKPSCSPKGDKLFVGVLPLLMLMLFVAIIVGVVDDDGSGTRTIDAIGIDTLGANSTNSSNVGNATVAGPAIVDVRAALVASANEQSRDVAVLTSTRVMVATTATTFGLFIVLRRRIPLYSYRNADKLPLKAGWLSWLPQLVAMNDEDVLQHAGFDAFLFLRIPQLACRFCVLAFFPMGASLVLLNHFASESKADGDASIFRLSTLTISNIEHGSRMLWLHAIGAWYMTWLLVMLLRQEEQIYIRVRHRYFRNACAQDYSIFVQDLPPDVRTSDALMHLFRKFYPDTDLQSCCVLPDCRHLATLMAKADVLAKKLEKALEVEARCAQSFHFGLRSLAADAVYCAACGRLLTATGGGPNLACGGAT